LRQDGDSLSPRRFVNCRTYWTVHDENGRRCHRGPPAVANRLHEGLWRATNRVDSGTA
jgi:hypothetical protein